MEVLFAWAFPYEHIGRATNLRWIQVMGAGVDALLRGPRLPSSVVVTNLKGVFGVAMAEYAIGYILAHAQKVRLAEQQQRARLWRPYMPEKVYGRTVGVAGLGSIGREVVARAGALGMKVLGLKRTPGDVPGVERVYTTEQIDEFLPQCDYLIFVLPHTKETAGLLTRERLQRVKRGAFLVNMGRGTLVKEEDLVEALRQGWLSGAALDVFAIEPLPQDSPLWDFDNVYITPHISGANRPDEVIDPFLENLGRYLRGEQLRNQVDLELGY